MATPGPPKRGTSLLLPSPGLLSTPFGLALRSPGGDPSPKIEVTVNEARLSLEQYMKDEALQQTIQNMGIAGLSRTEAAQIIHQNHASSSDKGSALQQEQDLFHPSQLQQHQGQQANFQKAGATADLAIQAHTQKAEAQLIGMVKDNIDSAAHNALAAIAKEALLQVTRAAITPSSAAHELIPAAWPSQQQQQGQKRSSIDAAAAHNYSSQGVPNSQHQQQADIDEDGGPACKRRRVSRRSGGSYHHSQMSPEADEIYPKMTTQGNNNNNNGIQHRHHRRRHHDHNDNYLDTMRLLEEQVAGMRSEVEAIEKQALAEEYETARAVQFADQTWGALHQIHIMLQMGYNAEKEEKAAAIMMENADGSNVDNKKKNAPAKGNSTNTTNAPPLATGFPPITASKRGSRLQQSIAAQQQQQWQMPGHARFPTTTTTMMMMMPNIDNHSNALPPSGLPPHMAMAALAFPSPGLLGNAALLSPFENDLMDALHMFASPAAVFGNTSGPQQLLFPTPQTGARRQ